MNMNLDLWMKFEFFSGEHIFRHMSMISKQSHLIDLVLLVKLHQQSQTEGWR
jgi:hypothetical protein